MALKKDRTSFTVATNLKTALNAKSLFIPFQTAQCYYSGSATDIHLLHEQFDDGSFRTTNVTPSGTSFDFIDPSDTALVRIWTERELQAYIGGYPGIEYSDGILSAGTWTWTIRVNGVDKTGTDTSKPDAIAKAFIKILQV